MIFSLHLGVGHSVLLQLEGVGHVFSNHHISKCSGPPPLPYVLFNQSLGSQFLSTFYSSVRCITAALKRTPIKDVERESKSVRSPKSKKVKRELRFDSSDHGDVDDDDDNDNEDPCDNNNDAYHSLSTKREEKQQHEAIEFHDGDCRVPIFARGKTVMGPLETMKVLLNPDTEYVCAQVQKNATFIVDMASLGSVGDVKCDDVGSWRNNSNVKFPMVLSNNVDTAGRPATSVRVLSDEETIDEEERKVILKREYYRLNHDVYNDFRKRIDTFTGE